MTDVISFSFSDSTGRDFPFTSLKALENFLREEISYWEKVTEEAEHMEVDSHPAIRSLTHLRKLHQTTQELSDSEHDSDAMNQKLVSVETPHPRNHRLAQQHSEGKKWLWHGHGFTPVFVHLLNTHGAEAADAFFDYIVNSLVTSLNSRPAIAGVLAAYEFLDQPDEHTNKKTGERISLSSLRNSFQESQEQLFREVSEQQQVISNWSTQAKNKQLRAYKAQKRLTKNLIGEAKGELDKQMTGWEERVKTLEDTYEEKLRLAKPAEYWDKSAKKFRNQGIFFAVILLISITSGALYIKSLIEMWMLRGETPISLSSIQGAVFFGMLAALYAFGVRVLSRLTFSSFHLMRDAEERHQLTHLYLSLINETESDERAREIVLQALFSRSETGLLATENGPTMPSARDAARIASGVSRTGS